MNNKNHNNISVFKNRDSGVNNRSLASQNPVAHFHREVDRWFNEAFRGFGFPNNSLASWFTSDITTNPDADISEDSKEYVISLEVPGVDKSDIKIDLSDNILTISGEKKQEEENKNKSFHRVERYYGKFERSFSLPEDIIENKIDAAFKNGVLTITIPRKENLQKPRKEITIR